MNDKKLLGAQEDIGLERQKFSEINIKKSDFGIMIGDKRFHGLGIASEALELIKHFSFDYLKLDKIKFRPRRFHSL